MVVILNRVPSLLVKGSAVHLMKKYKKKDMMAYEVGMFGITPDLKLILEIFC